MDERTQKILYSLRMFYPELAHIYMVLQDKGSAPAPEELFADIDVDGKDDMQVAKQARARVRGAMSDQHKEEYNNLVTFAFFAGGMVKTAEFESITPEERLKSINSTLKNPAQYYALKIIEDADIVKLSEGKRYNKNKYLFDKMKGYELNQARMIEKYYYDIRKFFVSKVMWQMAGAYNEESLNQTKSVLRNIFDDAIDAKETVSSDSMEKPDEQHIDEVYDRLVNVANVLEGMKLYREASILDGIAGFILKQGS